MPPCPKCASRNSLYRSDDGNIPTVHCKICGAVMQRDPQPAMSMPDLTADRKTPNRVYPGLDKFRATVFSKPFCWHDNVIKESDTGKWFCPACKSRWKKHSDMTAQIRKKLENRGMM